MAPIKISCAIESSQADAAVQALHDAFELHGAEWLINFLFMGFVIFWGGRHCMLFIEK